jgi:hypothetical protein
VLLSVGLRFILLQGTVKSQAISRPEQAKPTPAPVSRPTATQTKVAPAPSPKRQPSPVRSTPAASAASPVAQPVAAEKKAIVETSAPVQTSAKDVPVEHTGPPGFAKSRTSPTRASFSRKTTGDTPVVMPNNASNVSNVGVKFGSLSLAEDSEPVEP